MLKIKLYINCERVIL